MNLKFIKLGAALIVAALVPATQAFAEPATATRNVNVRSGPGTNFEIVSHLTDGEVVDRGNCNSNGSWCYVRHEGDDGWVAGIFLASPQPQPQPMPAGSPDYEAVRQVNIRSGPSTQFSIVDRLEGGDQVTLGQCTDGQRWCYVDHPGSNGWVAKQFLQSIRIAQIPQPGNTNDPYRASINVNVRSGPGLQFNVVDRLHQGEIVSRGQCTNGGDWCYVDHDGMDGWVAARFLTAVNGQNPGNGGHNGGNNGGGNNGGGNNGGGNGNNGDAHKIGVAVSGMPLRSAPSLFSGVNGQLIRGETVDIISCGPNEVWCQVHADDGEQGWVMAAFLNISRVDPQPDPQGQNMATTQERIALRAGPGTNHNVIGVVGKHQRVTITNCNPSGEWCQIRTQGGSTGWVAARYLEVDRPNPGQPQPQQNPNSICFTGFGNVQICLQ